MSTHTVTDTRGLDIRIGDRVRVVSYGYALRLSDVGRSATVRDLTRAGNVLLTSDVRNPIANGKAVHGNQLVVLVDEEL